MKILVPIKRVPDTDQKIEVKPDGSGIVTDGLPFVINPFDAIAFEEALRIREKRNNAFGGRGVRLGGWLLVFLLWGSISQGEDWPTCRKDSQRGGITPEQLVFPLEEVWCYEAPQPPSPAWPEPAEHDFQNRGNTIRLSPTVIFDRAFQVVVARNRLYYGSSTDDTVYCLDAASGETSWTFTTEGPVRLAPTIARDRVYVGSDDGHLYCLRASNGELLWKYRVGPEDRRLPGNERMISRWPVRCGIVVEDDRVYCAAGLFPNEGVYLCAVNAYDGQEVWKQKINRPAQGYLLASPEALFLPTGRSAPLVFDRKTGNPLGEISGGGCFGVVSEDVYVHAGGERQGGLVVSSTAKRAKIAQADGLSLIADQNRVYVLQEDRLFAVDREEYLRTGKASPKWKTPSTTPLEMIKAGDTILGGGDGLVAAYGARDGGVVWTSPVQGKAYALAVAEGCLFVSTDTGTIHCFRSSSGEKRRVPGPRIIRSIPKEPAWPEDNWTGLHRQAAEAVLRAAGTTKGYCLILGSGDGRLAYEIARQSNLQVIGLEENPQAVARARKKFLAAGIYGKRISIHEGKPDYLRYPRLCANLIVADRLLKKGELVATRPSEALPILHPFRGTTFLTFPEEKSPTPADKGSARKPSPATLLVGVAERGAVEGAGQWTHQYADPGNTACSDDPLPTANLEVQWFGQPGPRGMVDRHNRTSAPLFMNGRLFVSGMNRLYGVDAYNGTVLWEKDLPGSVRMSVLKNSGNMALVSDRLYVAAENRCHAFDPQTGEQRTVFSIPPADAEKGAEWGYIACVGSVLLGSASRPDPSWKIQNHGSWERGYLDFTPVVCSDSVFALDRHTGAVLWRQIPRTGVIINPAIAADGRHVYYLESGDPQTRQVANGRVTVAALVGKDSALVCLDLETGREIWHKPVDLRGLQHNVYLYCADQTLLVAGSQNVEKKLHFALLALDASSGEILWRTTTPPFPGDIGGGHGEQDQHPAIVNGIIYTDSLAYQLRTGTQVPGWKAPKRVGCATISASARDIFYRGQNPSRAEIATGEEISLTSVTRPGCWISIIPAGGLVLLPEASSGCTCAYSIQTSLALSPKQTVEKP